MCEGQGRKRNESKEWGGGESWDEKEERSKKKKRIDRCCERGNRRKK